MYAAIYGYKVIDGLREHLGNVTNIKLDAQDRVYDLSTASIEGYCDFSLEDALIYVINTEQGKQVSSGFVRNAKVIEGNLIGFKGEDFKRIIDTDILVDYTGKQTEIPTLQSLLSKVASAVQSSNQDDYMSQVMIQFLIPVNTTDVREIADYSGQYLIVNALKFLKVYLAFYGYFIRPQYEINEDLILFTFVEVDESRHIEIKLKDFKHERILNDIKINKAVATIKYTPAEEPPEWELTDEAYYISQPANNRATVQASEGMPQASGYSPGFALRVVTSEYTGSARWVGATKIDYDNARNRPIKTVVLNSTMCRGATMSEASSAAGNVDSYPQGTVVKIVTALGGPYGYELCVQITYIKKLTPTITTYTYYKTSEITMTKRPNLPEKIYIIGKDNKIYEGYESIEDDQRIYPVINKIFESTYLAEAQVNAVYELVNNRYIENIIITNESTQAPIDLSTYDLYQMFRVYDDEGSYKDLPIAEKIINHEKGKTTTSVKLGFKKTKLTEVIKNDIGEGNLVNQGSGGGGGGGSTQIIEEKYEIWDKPQAPPTGIDTWFKPISSAEGRSAAPPAPAAPAAPMAGSPGINTPEDNTGEIDVENELGADGTLQDDTETEVEVENELGAVGALQDDTETEVEVDNELGADGTLQDDTPEIPREE